MDILWKTGKLQYAKTYTVKKNQFNSRINPMESKGGKQNDNQVLTMQEKPYTSIVRCYCSVMVLNHYNNYTINVYISIKQKINYQYQSHRQE